MTAEPTETFDEDALPTGPRITVTELRPCAPATGAFLEGHTELDGRSLQISFGAGAPDGLWSTEALDAYFAGLESLPRGVPLRLLGRLTRSRENGRPRLRVRRVSDPDGTILWHDIPAGSIRIAGVLSPRKPDDRIAAILARTGLDKPKAEPFRADAFTHDASLLDRLESLDPDTIIEALSWPDNTLGARDFYQCQHCVRDGVFSDHEPDCPLGAKHRFLTGIRTGSTFIRTERRGAGTARRFRLFGPDAFVGDDFEVPYRGTASELQITRYDPADPGPYFVTEGWGPNHVTLGGIPSEFLTPVPSGLRNGLGLLAPDPIDLAPVEVLVSLEPGAPVAWGEGLAAPQNVFLWPQAIDTDGTPFAHSLTIFELDGGRAALPAAQAACSADSVWIEADERKINGHDDFDGVTLYDGDRRIGYAYE